jgi:Flp pilus assembly protein TadG
MSICIRRKAQGVAIVYVAVMISVLMGLTALAVDFARVQVAKNELRQATDAAAIYAVSGISSGTAVSQAITAAADNNVDGATLTISSANVTLGIWSGGVFTANSVSPNAVQVTTNYSVPLLFEQVLGQKTCNVTATSIATTTSSASSSSTVTGSTCPWLAGEPNGTTTAANPEDTDSAPACSPSLVTGISLVPGSSIMIDSATGGCGNGPSYSTGYGPEGDTGWTLDEWLGGEHDISDVYAPISGLLGVFLTNSVPDGSAQPAALDFSTSSSRNFTTLAPQLQQVFYIGGGTNSSGVQQQFIVPTGATRLYLCNMDGYDWANNIGSFSVTLHQQSAPVLVQ